MKNFILLLSVLIYGNCIGQPPEKTVPASEAPAVYPEKVKQAYDADPVYNTAGLEAQPEFPGGIEAFKAYFTESFNLTDQKLAGKIVATFTVEKDGKLTDIKILRDIGPASGKEAVRVLKNSPKWTPGKINGQSVRTMTAVPFIIGRK